MTLCWKNLKQTNSFIKLKLLCSAQNTVVETKTQIKKHVHISNKDNYSLNLIRQRPHILCFHLFGYQFELRFESVTACREDKPFFVRSTYSQLDGSQYFSCSSRFSDENKLQVAHLYLLSLFRLSFFLTS